jgi:hypothetical protein
MIYLTDDQHIEVLKRLITKANKVLEITPKIHDAGIEYTSLMNCFLLHNLSCAKSLLHLLNSFTKEWFPVAVGYTIVRPMFEIDLNSHYISKNPIKYSKEYIEFDKINKYKIIEAIRNNLNSNNSSWKEALNSDWKNFTQVKLDEIKKEYENTLMNFKESERKNRKKWWSGKSIKEMAIEVNHKEAYDIFYSELSLFTHVNVTLANRYLQSRKETLVWSAKSNELDIGGVFRYASIFLTCFLELYGEQFNKYRKEEIRECWIF